MEPEPGAPLRLTADQWAVISVQVRRGIPHEVCGLVGGLGCRALEVFPADNVAAEPAAGYEVDPQRLYDVLRLLDERGWELVAIYHSHPPGSRSDPSPVDVRHAAYPHAVHLIVVPDARGAVLSRRGFVIGESGQVVEVPVLVDP